MKVVLTTTARNKRQLRGTIADLEKDGFVIRKVSHGTITATKQDDARRTIRKSGLFTKAELELLEGDAYWNYYFD